ncbi:hypothetical protein VNO78_30723 [Psophocarpus tetragonolobus]|uniref:MADS-box domain-containing protein n=1 Tax=Psophocarpus tetragonolobus TaxID=3891 RepID=A0AAN9RXV7_PSOTE
MTRTKVKLDLIPNDSERKVSYKKRKKSLMKLTEDLTTLCGTEACVVVYGPYENKPEIWPSESGVQRVLEKFRNFPQWQQNKKMVNQESFITQNIHKGNEKIKKLVRDNNKKEMTMFMFQCLNIGSVQPYDNMAISDFNVLSSVIGQNLKDIGIRLEALNNVSDHEMTTLFQPQMQQTPSYYSYQPQMQPAALAVAPEETTVLNYDMNNFDPVDSQWVMNLLNGNGFGDTNLKF